MIKNLVIAVLLIVSVTQFLKKDLNSAPTYGEESGLPKNCRAIVQRNIDSYRNKEYTTDEIMESLERNCGANGVSWNP